MKGKCKWWNSDKGYGFIESSEGQDIFVHYSGIQKTGGRRDLREGEDVEFDVIASERGPKAENVIKRS